MNQTEVRELLVYMTTSAAGLSGEPAYYGPLRMIESAQRLCGLLLQDDPENETLRALSQRIEQDKHQGMTDPQAFQQMLNEAAAMSVDLIL